MSQRDKLECYILEQRIERAMTEYKDWRVLSIIFATANLFLAITGWITGWMEDAMWTFFVLWAINFCISMGYRAYAWNCNRKLNKLLLETAEWEGFYRNG